MKLTNLTTALLLVTSACGVVVEPSGDPAPSSVGLTGDEPPTDRGDGEPVGPPPLTVSAPRAATTPGSLFAMTFAADSPIVDVIVPEARGRIDVLEQTIVATTDDEIHLVLELARPTGTYWRVLVSDALPTGLTYTDRVLCAANNILTYDPRCEPSAPASSEHARSGSITTAQWRLTLIDDSTHRPVGSCISGPNRLSCALPAKAGASYQITVSAYGFADLWDGTAGVGASTHGGVPFAGAFANMTEWRCTNFATSGSYQYCGTRNEFVRFTALDRARLDFDPITVKITANGTVTAMPSPALSWDPGNDDVPGPTY